MCEDMAVYYMCGPLYIITSQQSSLAFLQHRSETQQGQPRFPFRFTHMRVFYRSICIFLFYVLSCVIGFRAHRLAEAVW